MNNIGKQLRELILVRNYQIGFAMLSAARLFAAVILVNSVFYYEDEHSIYQFIYGGGLSLWAILAGIFHLLRKSYSFRIIAIISIIDLIFSLLTLLISPYYAIPALLYFTFVLLIWVAAGRSWIGWSLIFILLVAIAARLLVGDEYWNDLFSLSGGAEIRDISIFSILLIQFLLILNYIMMVRKDRIDGLNSQDWYDDIFSGSSIFKYNLNGWTESFSSLFDRNKSFCAFVVRADRTTLKMFSNKGSISFPDKKQLGNALLHIDKNLTLISRDITDTELSGILHRIEDALHTIASEGAGLIQLKHYQSLLVRSVDLEGRQCLFICAHDNITHHTGLYELKQLDHAIDGMTGFVSSTLETRRTFLIEAREVARRDLHDGVLQSLAALRMRLIMISNSKDMKGQKRTDEIKKTIDIISLEQTRLRNLLHSDFDNQSSINLVETLKLALRTISLQWEIAANLVTDEASILVDSESAINIENLVREVVANAVRHKQSKQISIALALRDTDLLLTLIDLNENVSGVEIKHENDKVTLPLDSLSLKQRLALVNGHAYFEGLSKGALLSIRIPMTSSEYD